MQSPFSQKKPGLPGLQQKNAFLLKKKLSRPILLLRLQLSWPWQMAMRFLLTYTGTAPKDCNMYCSPPPQPPPPLKQLHWITLVTASSRHHLNCQHHRCPFTTILASTIFTDCHQKLNNNQRLGAGWEAASLARAERNPGGVFVKLRLRRRWAANALLSGLGPAHLSLCSPVRPGDVPQAQLIVLKFFQI